jgi:hypothetical protein
MISNAVPVERAQRFPIQARLQYRKSGMAEWLQAKTVNMSRTGILFQTEEILPEKTILDIRLDLPAKGTLSCFGRVVRIDKSSCAVSIYRCNLKHQ